MALRSEKFVAARKASSLTFEQASKAAQVKSLNTYMAHEKSPELFRLGELSGVYQAMNDEGRRILREAVEEIFLP